MIFRLWAAPIVLTPQLQDHPPGAMGFQSELRDHILSQPASFKKKREYTLEEVLGRGGFGKVVRAEWAPPGGPKKAVALK